MNSEETRFFNENPVDEETKQNIPSQKVENVKTNASKGGKAAAVVGGIAVGGAAGLAASSDAVKDAFSDIKKDDHSEKSEDDKENNSSEEIKEQKGETSGDDNAIRSEIHNDLEVHPDVKVAHVEASNFQEAFAQARAEVGPGGVFEYNGKLYKTFFVEEWNDMSKEERSDFLKTVYSEVPTSSIHTTQIETSEIELSDNHTSEDSTEGEGELKVLAVTELEDEDGSIMNVALVEADDDRALLVDVDNDGVIEVLLHDDNQDGQIQVDEVHDISEANIHIDTLIEMQEDMFLASDPIDEAPNDNDLMFI